MSGNSTQFGMALAHGDHHVVEWAGAVIACFVVGAFIGSLVYASGRSFRIQLVLACELVCFLTAWKFNAAFGTNVVLLFVALAMGMQNAIHEAVAGAATGKSFITGALFGTGDALARACLGKTHFAEAGANAFSWLAFVTGVTIGTFAVGSLGVASAILAAAGIVVALMGLTL